MPHRPMSDRPLLSRRQKNMRRIRPQPFLGDPWTQKTVLGIIGFNNLNSPGPCLKRYFGKILAWALKGGDGLFAQESLDCL